MHALPAEALDALFRDAHTHNAFFPDPVSDELLQQVWDLAKLGPTSANTSPLRIAFIRSAAAKERLRPLLSPGNVDKTMGAPVTAIFAFDLEFYENLPRLFPMRDLRPMFLGKAPLIESSARMNSALQAGYFILAARASGLDCGPMAGFDNAKTDAEFFAGTPWRSLFLCNLGHGDPSKVFPRSPRLTFEEACKVL